MPPSAVDWSEFHVWSFILSDIQKTQRKHAIRLGLPLPEVGCASCMAKRLPPKDRKLQVKEVSIPAVTKCHPSTMHTAYAHFAAGAMGGGTATYTTHWLDTVKVKMQTFPQHYRGGYHCLKDTMKEDGVRGLYSGATPAVAGQMCRAAVVFVSYGFCEELVRKAIGKESLMELSIWNHASAGAMTGVVASFVLCPSEVVKCRLQALNTQINTSKYIPRGTFSMMKHIVRSEGVTGLYRGLPGIWVKDVPGSFLYFGSYELAKSLIRQLKKDQHLGSRDVFLCGMFAGLCYCITHPLEAVKTRVQVMSAVGEHRGFMSSFVHILKCEGMKPLLSGLTPSILRAGMYSGIQFLTYESIRDFLMKSQATDSSPLSKDLMDSSNVTNSRRTDITSTHERST